MLVPLSLFMYILMSNMGVHTPGLRSELFEGGAMETRQWWFQTRASLAIAWVKFAIAYGNSAVT